MKNQKLHNYPKQEMFWKAPAKLKVSFRIYFTLLGMFAPKKAAQQFKEYSGRGIGKISNEEQSFLNTAKPLTFTCEETHYTGYSFGEGPLILLVHGAFGNAGSFRFMIPSLVSKGYRVVAFNMINHQGSPDGIFFTGQAVLHLKALIDHLGEIFAIVSHSAGTNLVAKALLPPTSVPSLKKCIYLAAHPDQKGNFLMFMDYLFIPPKVYTEISRLYEEDIGKPLEEMSMAKILPQQTNFKELSNLYIHDEEDQQIPFSRTKEFQVDRYGAELFATKGQGHFRMLKDEKLINKTIDFLKQ